MFWAGVNLLVGTENGLMLLDRSGQGKVYNLINRRRFQQMDVLEGLNVLVTISGWQLISPNATSQIHSWWVKLTKTQTPFNLCLFHTGNELSFHLNSEFSSKIGKKNKLRVYYLSWLRNRILHNDPEVEKKQGWITVGDLEGCVHYKVGTFRSFMGDVRTCSLTN